MNHNINVIANPKNAGPEAESKSTESIRHAESAALSILLDLAPGIPVQVSAND